jgi:hypothetical protein
VSAEVCSELVADKTGHYGEKSVRWKNWFKDIESAAKTIQHRIIGGGGGTEDLEVSSVLVFWFL